MSKRKRMAELEAAMFRRACGYTENVSRNFKLHKVEYEGGRRCGEWDELVTATEERHVPGDVKAAQFWLDNLSPAAGADRPEGQPGCGVVLMPEAKPPAAEEQGEQNPQAQEEPAQTADTAAEGAAVLPDEKSRNSENEAGG